MVQMQTPTIDWQGWMRRWDAQQQGYLPDREKRFKPLLVERENRLRWFDRAWINPSYDFQVGALREAGFREVGTFWQRRENRILLAIR